MGESLQFKHGQKIKTHAVSIGCGINMLNK